MVTPRAAPKALGYIPSQPSVAGMRADARRLLRAQGKVPAQRPHTPRRQACVDEGVCAHEGLKGCDDRPASALARTHRLCGTRLEARGGAHPFMCWVVVAASRRRCRATRPPPLRGSARHHIQMEQCYSRASCVHRAVGEPWRRRSRRRPSGVGARSSAQPRRGCPRSRYSGPRIEGTPRRLPPGAAPVDKAGSTQQILSESF